MNDDRDLDRLIRSTAPEISPERVAALARRAARRVSARRARRRVILAGAPMAALAVIAVTLFPARELDEPVEIAVTSSESGPKVAVVSPPEPPDAELNEAELNEAELNEAELNEAELNDAESNETEIGAELLAIEARGGFVPRVLRERVASSSPLLRGRLIRVVARRSPDRALHMLLAELDGVRESSALLREGLSGESPLEGALAAAVRREPVLARSPGRRDDLALVIAHSGVDAWPVVEALLAHEPRLDVIEACRVLGDPRALPRLARWVARADDVGRAALEAIGGLRGRDAVRELLRRYSDRPAIAARHDRAGALLRSREDTADVLESELRRGVDLWSTIRVFSELFPDRAVASITAVLPDARRDAIPILLRGLAELATRESLEALERALDDPRFARHARRHLARLARIEQ